jgi:LuxR family transcriptional regulator, maltose regulon positive regulatory protein
VKDSQPGDTGYVLLKTKLTVPSVKREIVHRTRLFSKFDFHPAKLVLVTAPAGFGKSTLILDWLRFKSVPFAWYAVDSSDNETKRFLMYFVSAFHEYNPSIVKKILSLLQGSSLPSLENVLTVLINDLQTVEEEFYMVLDDYQCIEEPAIHKALRFFTDSAPPHIHVLISTRVDPPFPLHRMRVRQELIEIRERDLRFTVDEAVEFFARTMQITLPTESVQILTSRTEGWVAGLQMAAVTLQNAENVPQLVRSFAGTNRYIVEYLLEEVLSRQPEPVQQFLLFTSVLNRFNISLGKAVAGDFVSDDLLEKLEHANLFLISLDEQGEWYRFHHLFAELLHFRLRQLYPEKMDELHFRASAWFEKSGDIDNALLHAFRMTSHDRAVYLLDMHGFLFLTRSELSSLLKYINRLPDDIVRRHAAILITKIWALLLTHTLEDPNLLLVQAERSLKNLPSYYTPEMVRYYEANLLVLRSFILRLQNKLGEAITVSMEGLKYISSDQPLSHGLLLFNLARVYMKMGFAKIAISLLEQGMESNRKAQNHYIELASLAHIGFLYGTIDSQYTAKAKLEEAIEYAEQAGIDDLPAMGYIFYQLGRVLYQLDRIDDAHEVLQRALEFGILGNEPDVLCNTMFILAWVNAARNRFDEARNIFNRAEEIEHKNNVRVFETDLTIERVYLSLLMGDMENVVRWTEHHPVALTNGEYTVVREIEAYLHVRSCLHRKLYDTALDILEQVQKNMETAERTVPLLIVNVIRSLIFFHNGEREEAFDILIPALRRIQSTGYIRSIVNMGKPILSILQEVSTHPETTHTDREFVRLLIGKLESSIPAQHRTMPKYTQTLAEPLTEREQEVLHYLSKGFANKEIADSMYISVDTVKTHLKNIYGKLDVRGRQEAVTRAREEKLL